MAAFLATSAWAIPALNRNIKVSQPDGSTIEIRKFGNEHSNYTGTPDGYPLEKDSLGYYRYIDEKGLFSKKKPPHRDDALRGLELRKAKKGNQSIPLMAPAALAKTSSEASGPSMLPAASKSASGESRALVILVQFNDIKFSENDPVATFDSLLNMEGYNKNNNIGSARDYFVQNSLGKFQPQFDVVGPITLSKDYYKNYGRYSSYGDYGAQYALVEALDTLMGQSFNFSPYDIDGDRYLDFVHMIAAGYGAHDSDQDSAFWPHKWVIQVNWNNRFQVSSSPRLYVANYACSSELDGYSKIWKSDNKVLTGVGTFLHEFSHLMGLPDLYATGDTPQATPSNWSIMDNGAYNTTNFYGPVATAPPYYSAFERMSLGWMEPTDLEVKGTGKIPSIEKNRAFRLTNPNNSDEFYLLEYRSGKEWDAALPNHGMLIWHIDYDKNAWNDALVNATEHQHVDLIEADNDTSSTTLSGNSFPGKSRVTQFSQFSLWDDTTLPVALSDITEETDYTYVSFNVNMEAPEGTQDLTIEPVESSSSAEEESSSSEEASESSSSEEAQESSSSEMAPESSSAETPIAESSSSEGTYTIAENLDLRIRVQAGNGYIHLSDLPEGQKTIAVFSLNGNLLYREKAEGSTFDLATGKIKGPAILLVTDGRKTLYSGKIR